jgi:type IV secretory pathway VirB10-like protein
MTKPFEKGYPSIVRMRPTLWIVGVLTVLILVIILITTTIFSIVKDREASEESETTVKQVSGSIDTNWYKNKLGDSATIITASEEKPAEVNPIPDANATHSTILPVAVQQVVADQSAQTNLPPEKPEPYSAPITSNQLTGDQFYRQQGSSGDTTGTSNNSSQIIQQSQKDAFLKGAAQSENPYLPSVLLSPISPYEVKAGAIIPAILMTGINSDLPGQIVAQVKSPVYDTVAGRHLLIPQGARLIGLYDSQVVYGQERVLVAWRRIIFPDGKSMDLTGMPGVDLSGYAGVTDKVNNHYGKIFGSVILMSILSAGAQLSQPQESANNNNAPSVNQLLAQSLGTNIANAGTTLLNKNIGIPPTLEIRPGHSVNISVTKDMVFPSPYGARI